MKKNKSTSQWIEKHRSDHYFQKAKEMGYRSRSSIKLIQIDDKYKLLKPGGELYISVPDFEAICLEYLENT